ncbi:MAG: amino acid permease [Bacteroidales bacterium]|jgi:APA family basic amino acid/polyamine antiporter|nr:amino acid permease [Bacteroidales bacterium]
MKNLFIKKNIGEVLKNAESGGLKRNLNVTNLIMLGVGAIVGTGIFIITGQVAAMYAGPALSISFLISALACVLAGLCYAEFAAMMPVSGSVYSYCYTALGELPAWFVGWTLIMEYLFACSSVAVGWSEYMTSLFDGWGLHLPDHLTHSLLDHTAEKGWFFTGSIMDFPAVFIVGIITAFLLGGTKQSALINNIIVVVKVAVILFFVGFGLSYVNLDNLTPFVPENTGEFGSFGWSGVLRGAAIVFYAYLGFDALSTAAQEVKNPQRDMPRGILISLLICAILYIAVTLVLTGIVPYTKLNIEAPIAFAIDSTGEGLAWLSPFIKIGAVAGITSVILVMSLGQSRIYYAISRDGLLPKMFSKINKRGVPINATLCGGIITAIIAGVLPLHVLVELVSIGTMLAFTIICISVIILRKAQPLIPRPFKTPWVPFIPLLGATICIAQMIALPMATWIRLILWTAIGLTVYFTYGIKHSHLRKTSKQ